MQEGVTGEGRVPSELSHQGVGSVRPRASRAAAAARDIEGGPRPSGRGLCRQSSIMGIAEAVAINTAKASFPDWRWQMFEHQRQKGLKNHVLTATPARGIAELAAKREMAVPMHHRPYRDQQPLP